MQENLGNNETMWNNGTYRADSKQMRAVDRKQNFFFGVALMLFFQQCLSTIDFQSKCTNLEWWSSICHMNFKWITNKQSQSEKNSKCIPSQHKYADRPRVFMI